MKRSAERTANFASSIFWTGASGLPAPSVRVDLPPRWIHRTVSPFQSAGVSIANGTDERGGTTSVGAGAEGTPVDLSGVVVIVTSAPSLGRVSRPVSIV